jgi:cellulose synthase/poly-beta-1,6-N-acetylglucosamine synthase-like glycosyltransferase
MLSISIALILLLALFYTWIGFPFLLYRATRKQNLSHPVVGEMPSASISVILAAHNEAGHISDRIQNLLDQKPTTGPFDIHVGTDGCSDATAENARDAARGHDCVHVHEFEQRRGKVAVLKDLVSGSSSDLLVFTDANTNFLSGAFERLLPHFADSKIGGVCGKLVLVRADEDIHSTDGETPRDSEEGFYWGLETDLKIRESALDSCLGANGAIFAMRRELFWDAMPDNTRVDDLVIGMKVREAGYRVLYEPSAIAVENMPERKDEWGRRVRIGSGDYQALLFCRKCLAPSYGRFAWIFWSHKVFRWFTPHLCLGSALMIWPLWSAESCLASMLAAITAMLVLLFLFMGLLGHALRDSNSSFSRIPKLFTHFVSMQVALMAGFCRFASGRMSGHWRRTPR